MTFTGTLYKVAYPRISRNNVVALASLAALCIIILLRKLPLFTGSGLLYFIIPIFSVFPLLRLYAWFNVEEHSKTDIGQITFSPEGLVFNGGEIEWGAVTKIVVSLTDFERKFEYKSLANYSNNRSAGVRNEVIVEVNGSEVIRGHLFLASQKDIDLLKAVLWEIVEKNRLPLDIAKSLVSPESYGEHQRVREYSGQEKNI